LDKSKFFTSKNALVPLVYCLANHKGKRLERDVLRFFLLSQLSAHYGRAGETVLNKDFRVLSDSPHNAGVGLAALVDSVKTEAKEYYRGLKIQPKHVEGVASKNVLVLLMYILMRRTNATDWGNIFPFDYMNKNDPLKKSYFEQGYNPAEFREQINDIANLTFLSQWTNAGIEDAPPSVYLLNETTEEMRRAHFIPEDQDFWKTENYPKFVDARRRLLARAMTKLLKTL
jgi:hypothetical protein